MSASQKRLSQACGNDTFEVMKNEQGRTVFKLPYAISSRFKPLFDDIDGDKQKYGIKDYSIRCSTLEEVFIKIGEEEDKLEDEEFEANA